MSNSIILLILSKVKYFLLILNKIFYMNTFSERLKELRKEKELTLKQVSFSLNIPLTTYANYEQGVREPSLQMLNALCDFFEVTSDYLIGRTDNY